MNKLIVIFLLSLLTSSCLFQGKQRQRPYAESNEESEIVYDGSIINDSIEGPDWLEKIPLSDDLLDVNITDDPAEKKKKKKKVSKNEFFGVKTKKGFAKRGMANDLQVETYRFIAELPPPPDNYVRDYHWYDIEKREVSRNRDVADKKGFLLHGSYQRSIGGDIVEEGMFYKGLKHGRWLLYNRDFELVDKEYYYKGWPIESEIVWYDGSQNKMKEITPIEYGEREGNFYIFHENGQIAVAGQYRFDSRVGLWTEYYRMQRRPKRQIQYSPDPFDKNFQPYIVKEWDEQGNLIYETQTPPAF